MAIVFDLESGCIEVQCNYQHQLCAAILRFDPFQGQGVR